jgi:uncharacterized protein YdaU (DUF1376 family)
MNFYPFHIGDYISHTTHLSDEEDLAYRRMMDLYYLNEQPFNDSSTLARRIKADVGLVEDLLNEFFVLYDDKCWHNKRIDEEIAKYHNRQNQASKAGKASVQARLNRRLTPVQPTNTRTKNQNQINIPLSFDLFWNAYNKKVGKPNSLKAWAKINFEKYPVQEIVDKAKTDKAAKPDNKFRKDPERWLRGQHWLDEVVIAQKPEVKELPLGTEAQIEAAYRAECGDPSKARFNSYFEMRNFIVAQREKRKSNV